MAKTQIDISPWRRRTLENVKTEGVWIEGREGRWEISGGNGGKIRDMEKIRKMVEQVRGMKIHISLGTGNG